MLNCIRVNNFRSLRDFTLEIRPGLNVLVGPNGSGKTNIIKWLEFLSLIGKHSLREAIGRIGGANQVFSRNRQGSHASNLDFYVSGFTTLINRFYFEDETDNNRILGNIFYEIEASISVIENQIFFSKQEIKIWISSKELRSSPSSKANIIIDWSYDALIDDSSININVIKPRGKNFSNNSYGSYLFSELEHVKSFIQNKNIAENLIINSNFYQFDIFQFIASDLQYARAYNIIPNSVRSTLDISSPPAFNSMEQAWHPRCTTFGQPRRSAREAGTASTASDLPLHPHHLDE